MGTIKGHEEYWGAHRNRGSSLHARAEVIVERAAQMMICAVFERKLTGANLRRPAHTLDDSADYISGWRNEM